MLGTPLLGSQAQPCSLTSLQNFLYKCIGTTLGAASSTEVVRKRLQELLETARYQEESEREVAAPSPREARVPTGLLAVVTLCPLRRVASVCTCVCVWCAQMHRMVCACVCTLSVPDLAQV